MRKNAEIVPENESAFPSPSAEIDPEEHAIAVLAHELWSQRGRPEGSPELDWFRAEEILRGRY
jgi:hypothetical protein